MNKIWSKVIILTKEMINIIIPMKILKCISQMVAHKWDRAATPTSFSSTSLVVAWQERR